MTNKPDEIEVRLRIERRLKRERKAREEAERIAEDATRRLYREQQKLTALLNVATIANETDSIVASSRECLLAVTQHTQWKSAHAYYRKPDGETKIVAWIDQVPKPTTDAPKGLLSSRARELLETSTNITIDFLEEPIENGIVYYCVCSVCAGGRCYGVIEAFSDKPAQTTFARELLEGVTQQLGYVYRREWDRHAGSHYAYHDPLTGVGNRLLFLDRLHHGLRRSDREDQRLGLVFIDIDGFKSINDQYGHAAGDQYLQLIAQRLEKALRDADTVARLGGDEFGLILEAFDDPKAGNVLVKRLIAILTKPALITGVTVTPAVSAGLALYPDDASDFETLINCADSAMYSAKAAGGSRIANYNAQLTTRVNTK